MANMLYNGVELPDINTVWTDKTTYPYAHIYETNGMYGLVISTHPALFRTRGSYTADYLPTGAVCMQYAHAQTEWYYMSSKTISNTSGYAELNYTKGFKIIWASYDVYRSTDNEFAENNGSLYLAASDPVPVGGSHITTSSGDGYALYNGVKLPALPNYDKSKYPYCFIGYNEEFTEFIIVASDRPLIKRGESSSGGMNAEVFGANEGVFNHAAYSLIHDEKHAEELGVPAANKWLFAGYIPDTVERNVYGAVIWSNYDILNADGSLYLAASDPIPLDGMTVIEWDGNTEGLDSFEESFTGRYYKVTDYVITKKEIENGSTLLHASVSGSHNGKDVGFTGTFIPNADSYTELDYGMYAAVDWENVWGYGVIPTAVGDASAGTYLWGASWYETVNYNNQILAYPASGGDDGGGDTSTALKHYGRVNGSVHEIEGGLARVSGSYHEIEVGTVRIEGTYYEIGFDGESGGSGGGEEDGGSLDGVIFQAGEGLLQGTVTATPNNPSFTSVISYSVTDSYITTTGGNVQQTVGGNTVYVPAFYTLTIGPFDATDYDTLHVELTSNIGVVKCESDTDSVASGVITNSATAEEVTLDISGLSGECSVVIAPSSNITSNTIFNATIYKIWLT